jgi:serine/threonine protein kinase
MSQPSIQDSKAVPKASQQSISKDNEDEPMLAYWQDPADVEGKCMGYHQFQVKADRFVVDTKYQPIKPLGSGAYGVVCSAKDRVANKRVAIKKIGKTFDDLVDAKRILRELKLLRHFNHENIVSLLDLVPPLEEKPFEDIYCVMDLLDTDLHKIIYSKNTLTDDHIKYFVYQILRGMKYIHSASVLHRDLKPSNLLLNGNCDLKICDFGLARGVDEGMNGELTEYVVTRWYRAPEVMCACQAYDAKIDVW